MHEEPQRPTAGEVTEAVAGAWRNGDGMATHLPVGFGAHHWRCGDLFVTLDPLGGRHTSDSLERAYSGAVALREGGCEFVLAPLPAASGRCTVPLAGGALSATPWRDDPRADRPADAALLSRLHAAPPPPGLALWSPLVGADLADRLVETTGRTWDTGPYGEPARRALRDHLGPIARWSAEYHRRAAGSDPATWVPTHGEPHERNLLVGTDGPLLVDWETLLLAPAERDLRQCDARGERAGDPGLLAMFDLEWRLDEVSQYAAWFAAPHEGGADDRTAYAGLLAALRREDHHTAGEPSAD